MNLLIKLTTILFTISILSGCLYPDEKLTENQVPYIDQLNQVQTAVNQFKNDTNGLLPIKTRDMKTPIYQKYPIDFNRLIPKYMSEPPGSAFENGGTYLYVLVDVETNPTVKLIDLHTVEQVRELEQKVLTYRQSQKYPPFETVVDKNKGVFTLNYKELGYKEPPVIKSPYTGKGLPLVIDGNGDIYVDYRLDLVDVLKTHYQNVKSGEDIRNLLVANSMFVPAFSLPYTINQKNEPIFLAK